MEVVAAEAHGSQLVVDDLDALGVVGLVQAGVDFEAGASGGRGDQADDDLV
jgi:hypothetical protein